VHYLDSSAWVKRHFEETGSERVHRLFNGKEAIASSWLGCVEVSAAIARQAGARRIDVATRRSIEAQLDYEWSRFLQAGATQEDFVLAVDLAHRYGLRGADAVHLAIARKLSEQFGAAGDDLVFWTSDEELVEAGRKTGLPVENPLDPVG
jgi:predicted nucleic acid-binding protein